MDDQNEILSNLVSELRRGTIVLSVLAQISTTVYGYSLVQELKDRGLDVEANTLYPLLRRLEKQGLLRSEWETTSGKPRKYYEKTEFGERIYRDFVTEWSGMVGRMENLIKEGEKHE